MKVSGWKVERYMQSAVMEMYANNRTRIRCPCARCKEGVLLDPFDRGTLKAHLLMNGFMDGYTQWISEDDDDDDEDSRRPGNGVTQTCLPAAHDMAPSMAQYGTASSTTTKTLVRAKPREADDTKTSLGAASPGWLPRSGDIYARCTSRGSYDVSRDNQG
jgi:hypothetical protein